MGERQRLRCHGRERLRDLHTRPFGNLTLMLVLTRKEGQGIRIGKGITVRVAEVSRLEVRLSIDAPEDVPVLREELLLKKDPPR